MPEYESCLSTGKTSSIYDQNSDRCLTERNSGGIRGIMELEVLKAIETELGGTIPIQAFFDLIIGTRCVCQCLWSLRPRASADHIHTGAVREVSLH